MSSIMLCWVRGDGGEWAFVGGSLESNEKDRVVLSPLFQLQPLSRDWVISGTDRKRGSSAPKQ